MCPGSQNNLTKGYQGCHRPYHGSQGKDTVHFREIWKLVVKSFVCHNDGDLLAFHGKMAKDDKYSISPGQFSQ